MPEIEEFEDIPLSVIERQYEDVQDTFEAERRFHEQMAEHYRKLLRMTLLLLGVVATAVGYLATSESTPNIESSACTVKILGQCIPLWIVASLATICYIFSIASFMALAGSVGLRPGVLKNTKPPDNSSEKAYLQTRIEAMKKTAEANVKIREEIKFRGDVAQVSLLFGLVLTGMGIFSISTGNGVPFVSAILLFLLTVAIMWVTGRVYSLFG